MRGGRRSLHRSLVAAVAAVTVMAAAQAWAQAWAQARAQDAPPCRPPVTGTATVQSAIDGRTLKLTDGRELRLAGIEAPVPGDATARAATAALAALAGGRAVTLHRLGPQADRYGRISALATAGAPAAEPQASDPAVSLQVALLAGGHARVAARVGDVACAAQFLRAERVARAAGLGLWAEPHYLVRKAENAADLLAERGRFTVVEGQVLSVRPSGGTIYVNFGRRWSQDFTVTVAKRNERRFAAAGQELSKLAGRRVRVRGTLEERGGPWIEAAHPEQIEIAERD